MFLRDIQAKSRMVGNYGTCICNQLLYRDQCLLRPTRILIQCHGEKWKYEPTFFLAKNKNEDSDLGWTADLKINLDKL